MRRILVALALVAAGCGGTAAPTPDPAGTAAPAATTPSSTAPESVTTSTTAAVADTGASTSNPTSSATTTTSRQKPEGQDAPDFTLALGQGGVFTLPDEQKPVYMVFWAEW